MYNFLQAYKHFTELKKCNAGRTSQDHSVQLSFNSGRIKHMLYEGYIIHARYRICVWALSSQAAPSFKLFYHLCNFMFKMNACKTMYVIAL